MSANARQDYKAATVRTTSTNAIKALVKMAEHVTTREALTSANANRAGLDQTAPLDTSPANRLPARTMVSVSG
jgi:hypothetical protein